MSKAYEAALETYYAAHAKFDAIRTVWRSKENAYEAVLSANDFNAAQKEFDAAVNAFHAAGELQAA